MNEFKFTEGSLEAQGLQEGDKVECTYSDSAYFSVGEPYIVYSHIGTLYVFDDEGDITTHDCGVKLKPVSKKTKHSDFQDALEYLDTFGIPAEVTEKGMHIEGELTKVQWLDFAKIILEGEE